MFKTQKVSPRFLKGKLLVCTIWLHSQGIPLILRMLKGKFSLPCCLNLMLNLFEQTLWEISKSTWEVIRWREFIWALNILPWRLERKRMTGQKCLFVLIDWLLSRFRSSHSLWENVYQRLENIAPVEMNEIPENAQQSPGTV